MAKRTKADLGTALGALIAPPAGPEAPASQKSPTPNRHPSDSRAGDDGTADAGGYARTSTGYRRGSGETVRRLSLFLTERQRTDLKRKALDAGAETVTEYVVEALGLGSPTR